jgi:biotin transport system substrate-specific component
MTTAPTLALTLSERVWKPSALVADATLVALGSLVMAGLAQLAIPLPFTPVPITGQTLGVLLVGAALGSRRGAAAMVLYLVEGGAGLPFFAAGGAGPQVLLGPSGGYLLGFVLAAFSVGLLAERGLDRRFRSAALAFCLGELIVYLHGVVWLAFFVGADRALAAGFWPFLPGAVVKAAAGGALLPAAWTAVRAWESGERQR